MIDNKMNRRGFFKVFATVAGAAIVAPAFLRGTAQAQEKRRGAAPAAGAAGGAMPMVDPKDTVAKAVKYVEDHSKAADAKGNHCSTCGFYAKKEVRAGKEVGTCTIFAGKLVAGPGWCASWNKKA
ncbi:high-potential iron-sulfur protein [Bdellovibrio sp. HCB209]|uniref:high-potential iron-sulfur protein n=1 Tax=Bdellovibrio sp. HCB209 TaxID=3394354 RepID=UPI0039B6A02D